MRKNNIWLIAKQVQLQVSSDITKGFDIGFDDDIPEEMRDNLRRFIAWVEENFNMPITLWVDFEHKHYLLDKNKNRCGFLFYWSDFSAYPVFDCKNDIPSIRLPVRDERYSFEEILTSFIEAISCYFNWIANKMHEGYTPDEDDVNEILAEYLKTLN